MYRLAFHPHVRRKAAGSAVRATVLLLAIIVSAPTAHAQSTGDATNVTNEYRITAFPHYPIYRNLSGLLYYANWGRAASTNDLVFNEHIFRLNVKIGVSRALLSHVWDPSRQ